MAKFSAILIAATALIVGTQAAVTPRQQTCAAGTVACGYDLVGKYGLDIGVLEHLTPEDLSEWDSRFVCGKDNTVESYVDTCAVGKCVGDNRRPGQDDAICDAY